MKVLTLDFKDKEREGGVMKKLVLLQIVLMVLVWGVFYGIFKEFGISAVAAMAATVAATAAAAVVVPLKATADVLAAYDGKVSAKVAGAGAAAGAAFANIAGASTTTAIALFANFTGAAFATAIIHGVIFLVFAAVFFLATVGALVWAPKRKDISERAAIASCIIQFVFASAPMLFAIFWTWS